MKASKVMFFIFIILMGCDLNENQFQTKDRRITFQFNNKANVSNVRLDKIRKETLSTYDEIMKFNTKFQPAKKIVIEIEKGKGISTGYRNEVKLYSVKTGNYPLVHELSHTLLGYGNDFDTNCGYFTQEGFAIYLQNKLGKPYFPNETVPIQRLMKTVVESNKNIPLHKLIDQKTERSFFRASADTSEGYTIQWLSYLESGSFVSYLIENYGIKRFEKVFNKRKLEENLSMVYGKGLPQLENDWLDSLIREKDPSQPEINGFSDYYSLSEMLFSLDESIFQK
ncbi:hypothetical protein RCG23_10750 [Neobacillus sp. PS3-34]|uniref:hypothetical protein n=1 Tax=Neobacillus sp. PS3-34 TaxID=3070678 RepID=UPI0027E1B347|nr:hypothetical protein [Neobacillus sp. PS3-34]WML50235.1 hypothetical protein RCG23_10750 [Neobacillus sp. PS3-34]